MRHFILFLLILLSTKFSDATENDQAYKLSNQIMDVVTHMKEYPSDGRFRLNDQESKLVKTVAINDYMIGEYAVESMTQTELDCLKAKGIGSKIVSEELKKRDYRIGAILIDSRPDFKKSEQLKYNASNYDAFMMGHGYSVKKNGEKGYYTSIKSNGSYNWDNLIKRFIAFNDASGNSVMQSDVVTRASKLGEYIKIRTGLDVPHGALVSEFTYRDLLDRPQEWKSIFEKSKDLLDFNAKIELVGRLGNNFNDDYNFERARSKKSGIISLETMLKNYSTDETGGVCRDVALAQAQMLDAMGIKDTYIIGYATQSGLHATLVTVDPADKNRVIKMNYGQLSVDDGKKGKVALDQDNELPNAGFRYRIYDKEGAPVTIVPTEIGSLLKEATGQEKDLGRSRYSLNKVYFGNEKIEGALFSGETSTGEKISGATLYGNASSERITAEARIAAYKMKADKTYHTIDQDALYAQTKLGLKATVHEGVNHNIKGEFGTNIEILRMDNQSVRKEDDFQEQATVMDGNLQIYGKADFKASLTPKDEIDLSVEVTGRLDRANVSDSGNAGIYYESTKIISTYDRKHSDNLTTSISMANTLTNYGENLKLTAALKQGANKYSVEATTHSGDGPSFLPGQQDSIAAAFERDTEKWNFKLEYEKNLENQEQTLKAGAFRKF